MREKLKILIVDDSPHCRKAFTKAIPKKDMEIVGTVSDGRQVIDYIKNLKPDIVVTDVVLPFADGLEVIKKVSDEFKENKPVIIVNTAADTDEIIKKAMNYGASYFMAKPCDYKHLIKIITELADLRCKNQR